MLTYKNSAISYWRIGTGRRIVFCFHGYGEEGGIFEFLEKYAGAEYSFYALDVPFHGRTNWNEGSGFNPEDLQNIIREILVGEPAFSPVSSTPPDKSHPSLNLLGFSLGGRMALSLYQAIPRQIEKIVLLAPDGLKMNFWYWVATQTWMGRKLFWFTMKYPGWFFLFLRILNKLKLVNTSIFKFVNYYVGDKQVRKELYNRWISLRGFKPDPEKIKSLIKEFKTPIRLVYGKHDRIILPARGEKFRKGIEEYSRLNIIDSGHQLLHEKHAEEILESLKV